MGNPKVRNESIRSDRVELVRQLFDSVKELPPTDETVETLLASYESCLFDDERLVRAAADGTPIDGMTEILSGADIREHMTSAQSRVLAVTDPTAAEKGPHGFVIVVFCSDENASVRSFREYFLEKCFDGPSLDWVSADARRELEKDLAVGHVLSVGEVVSLSPSMSMAIALAIHRRIVLPCLVPQISTCVMKCLDSVSFEGEENKLGNVRAKAMVRAFGLRPIAYQTKTRLVQMPDGNPSVVQLRFGLYHGRGATAWSRLDRLAKSHGLDN